MQIPVHPCSSRRKEALLEARCSLLWFCLSFFWYRLANHLRTNSETRTLDSRLSTLDASLVNLFSLHFHHLLPRQPPGNPLHTPSPRKIKHPRREQPKHHAQQRSNHPWLHR